MSPREASWHSEAWFRALIEHSADVIALTSADGIVTYASPSTERVLGYAVEEFIGSNISALFHPDDREYISTQLGSFDEPGGTISFENRIRHKDGSWRWVEGTVTNLLHDPIIGAYVSNYRDITERKLQQERLRESEERYRALVEQASDGIFITDPQGRYIDVNPAGCAMSGYTREELLTRGIEDLAPEESRDAVTGGMKPILAGETMRNQWYMKRKDGGLTPIELTAKQLTTGQVVGLVRDISTRLQAEEERAQLLASEQEARALAEAARSRLYDLFMQAPANIAILTGPDHRLELANPLFLQTTGHTEDILGKPAAEAMPDLARQGYTSIVDRVYTTGIPFFGTELPVKINRHGKKEPEEGFFNFVYQPFHNVQGEIEGVMVHGVEVTEQVQARQRIEKLVAELQAEKRALSLAQQEAAYRASQLSAIFDAMTDGMIVCDNEGRVLQTNATFRTYMGMAAPAGTDLTVINMQAEWLVLRDQQGMPLAQQERPLFRVLHGERLSGNSSVDVMVESRDGQRRFLNASGAPITDAVGQIMGGVVVLRDVTERHELEQRLRYSEQKLNSLVNANIIGIGIADTEGKILEANDWLVRMFGYSREEMRSADFHWSTLTPPELREAEMQIARTLLSTGAIFPWEREYVRKDGSRFPALTTAALVDQERGLSIVIVMDLTERKAAEQRQQEFLSMVSHELRNPLAGIVGFLDLALFHTQQLPRTLSPEVDALTAKIESMLLQAEKQSEIENRLIEALLDVSRMQQHTFDLALSWCNLTKIVQDVVSYQQPIVGSQRISLQLPPQELVPVIADSDRIGQVINNYLNNALKYSPPDQEVVIGLEIEGANARVFVRDHGPGLSPQQQQQVWERFYQTHDPVSRRAERGGLGLGLYIARIIIEQHQGQVGVESQPGQGSTFWFTLPLVYDPAHVPVGSAG